MSCVLCDGPAMKRRNFRVEFRVCGKCANGYKDKRDLPRACEVAASTANNRALQEALLEAAGILRKVLAE